jgi:hypothetical protein
MLFNMFAPAWLQSLWGFLWGWASIDMLIGVAAVAIAVLEPKFMDRITDLRKWAICTAVVAFTLAGAIAHGYKNGIDEKQRQWDNALVKEATEGETARTDAVDSVGPVPASRELLRSDPFNRNRGK